MEIAKLIFLFLIGLILIMKGADWLTDGASSIARRFHISSLVIGLTIVAFGTSAPELVVSCISALNGKTDMAIGNVVGSNIFNVLAIMGTTALIAPVKCTPGNIRYDVPLCLVASIALFAMCNDRLLDFHQSALPLQNTISRSDGIVLLCFMAIFLSYTFAIARSGKASPANAAHDATATNASSATANPSSTDASSSESAPEMPIWRAILLFLIGLAMLVFGGDWLTDGASGIASHLGVSDAIIALTIVAAGTSFPELVTSIVAARKGDTDMAMGNVVGSCIFNIFLILGTASMIAPLSLGNIQFIDLATMLLGVALLWIFCRFGRRTLYITRLEGLTLVLVAIAYYAQAVINA